MTDVAAARLERQLEQTRITTRSQNVADRIRIDQGELEQVFMNLEDEPGIRVAGAEDSWIFAPSTAPPTSRSAEAVHASKVREVLDARPR